MNSTLALSAFLFVGVFLVSAYGTGLFRSYALRVQLLDHPNARSSHEVATPRGGGIALVVVFFSCIIGLALLGYLSSSILLPFLGGGVLVFAVGVVDDYYQLSSRLRLLVHIVAALILLYLLPVLPDVQIGTYHLEFGPLELLFLTIALAWLINLYNFMDGIDGIAGAETCCVAGGALCIIMVHGERLGYVFMLMALCAVTIGFLWWNWPPAKIFMGDGCSGFLGFCLGACGLITAVDTGVTVWAWLILLALFVADATTTLVTRMLRRDQFLKPHRSHGYQILSRRWGSHKKVTLGLCVLNLLYCVPLAILASLHPAYGFVIACLTFMPLVYFLIRIGAGTTNN